MKRRIGFLGLGAMGSRMAKRLLAAGHDVAVYNRSPGPAAALGEAGATVADSARDAATDRELVLSMVRDDEASAEIWLDPERGALAGLGAQTVAVECSTLSPAGIGALRDATRARPVALLDAPVVGTLPHAENGQLVFLVGGEATALDTARAVLDELGAAVHHLGAVGRGTSMKLAVNALFGVQIAALAELLGVLRSSGIDGARAMEVLGTLPVTSPVVKGSGALMVSGTFEPLFPVGLVEKDLGYLVRAAQDGATTAPVTAAARAVFDAGVAAGLGAENLVAVAKLYTE